MGKIEISEDLRDKLNKVLSYKSEDIGDVPVGPAPKWKPPQPQLQPPLQQPLQQPPLQPQQPPQPPLQPQQPPLQPPLQQPPLQPPLQPQYYFVKPEVKSNKKNKKKDKMKYSKITKVVFLSSIVAGIGITLGIKIATILFF